MFVLLQRKKFPAESFCVFDLYLVFVGPHVECLGDCFSCHFCREGRFLVDKWETLVLSSFLMLIGGLEQVTTIQPGTYLHGRACFSVSVTQVLRISTGDKKI